MPACPTPQVLERLLAEALPAAEGAALEAHIEQCAACQDRLERLTASARWTGGKLSKEEKRWAEEQFPPALLTRLLDAGSRLSTLHRSADAFLRFLHIRMPPPKSNAPRPRPELPPVITRDQAVWLEADRQAAARRRAAPLVVALLWPVAAALAAFVLLVLAHHIVWGRN
jgi:hypothetical protein